LDRLSIPGKVFLIGEYGVIHGGRAILAALKPPFEFSMTETAVVHPDSPVGMFMKDSSADSGMDAGTAPKLVSQGLGKGFGTSTAELIAGAFSLDQKIPEKSSFWLRYRNQVKGASGADLAVQLSAMEGKGSLFEVCRKDRVESIAARKESFVLDSILIFVAPKTSKLMTHVDLAKVRLVPDVEMLDRRVDQIRIAIEKGDLELFSAFNDFADDLHRHGLETPFAHQIRNTLRHLDGVIGVKGCGAGLNDVFLVVVRDASVENQVQKTAASLGLTWLGSLGDLAW
jgi:mevalonate kinase